MDVCIADVLVSGDTLPAVEVVLTPPGTLASDGYQMVWIELTDQLGSLSNPLLKGRQHLFGESSGLVADLPRHDGRIVLIGLARISVRA